MSVAEAEARRWLDYAHSDLAAAQALLEQPDSFPRQVCFSLLTQQAAEKALKAALVLAGADVPRSHDLDVPRNLLPEGWRTKAEHPDLAALSIWAVDARYPSDNPDAVQSDAQFAVAKAQAIWEAIRSELTGRGLDPSA
jgi:HEPN domain-containing protein